MTDADWPTFAANIRENFRAILQDAMTIAGAKTFSSHVTLNNALALKINNSVAVGISVITITGSNELQIGTDSAAGMNDTLLQAGQSLRIRTNSAERVRVDNSGNVGIGAAAPAGTRLHITGGDFSLDSDDAAAAFDAAGLRRFGIVKMSGLDPELRFLSSIGVKVRRVPTGTIKVPTSSDVVAEFRSDGKFDATGGLLIGTGTAITKHLSGTAAWNPGLVAAGAVSTVTITVTGAAIGDTCTIGFNPALATPSSWRVWAQVTAANTVVGFFENRSGGGITPAATAVRTDVWQH